MDRIETIYQSLPPMIQMAVTFGLLAAFALIAMCFLSGKRYKFTLFAVALLCTIPALNAVLAYHPELVDARYRTYKDFYAELRPGMTREDILFTEEKYYPSGGERSLPRTTSDSPTFVSFCMNPENGKGPNCEAILLTLKDGRLVSKEYTPN